MSLARNIPLSDHHGWRLARFEREDRRLEFLDRLHALTLSELEFEGLGEGLVRFRAPARFEVGLAGMVAAHGGKMVPAAVAEGLGA